MIYDILWICADNEEVTIFLRWLVFRDFFSGRNEQCRKNFYSVLKTKDSFLVFNEIRIAARRELYDAKSFSRKIRLPRFSPKLAILFYCSMYKFVPYRLNGGILLEFLLVI